METFKTPKGTVLPLMDIKGKKYLQVAHRVVWFREEHNDWGIETEVKREENQTIGRAIIKDSSGRIIATATKFEDAKGFSDHTEKAETGAIGRALALCGYGTQFTTDLDEGERLADSPVEKKSPVNVNTNTPLPKVAQTTSAGSAEKISNPTCPKCGGKTRPSIYPSSGDFYCENYRNSDHKGLKIFKEQDLGEDVR